MTEQEIRVNAMLAELQQQRDIMALRAGQLAGELAVEQAKRKEIEAQLNLLIKQEPVPPG